MKLTEKNMCYIDSLSYAQMLDHWRNAGPGDFWLEGETSSYWIERMNNLSHITPPPNVPLPPSVATIHRWHDELKS